MDFLSHSKDALSLIKSRKRYITLTGSTLFVDISGFTSLVDKYQAQGAERLEQLMDEIENLFDLIHQSISKNKGEIAYFAGDALLAYFKNDLNRERAQYATFDIINSLKNAQLKVKGGIASGKILIAPIPLPGRVDFLFTGEPINRAVLKEHEAKINEFPMDMGMFNSTYSDIKKHIHPVDSEIIPLSDPYVSELKKNHFKGEWRNVTVMFVNYEGSVSEFLSFIYDLSKNFYSEFNKRKIYFDSAFSGDKGNHILLVSGMPVSSRFRVENMLSTALLLKGYYNNKLRIGISNGRVIGGFIGSKTFKKFTVMGEVVNIAARLMQKAELNEILFHSEWKVPVKDFKFKFRGNLRLKGIKNEIEAYIPLYHIQGQKTHKFFVNREKERKEILSILKDSKGNLLAITGKPGIGKTALLLNVLNTLKEYSLKHIAFYPQRSTFISSYSTVRTLLKNALKNSNEMGSDTLSHEVSKFLNEFIEGKVSDYDRLSRILPGLLASVLESAKINTVAIDDFQEIDTESKTIILKALDFFTFNLLLTSRKIDNVLQKYMEKPESFTLPLYELKRNDVVKLISKILGNPPHPYLVNFIIEKSSGNPLIMLQLLRILSIKLALSFKDGYWILNTRVSLPEDMFDIFMVIFDELPAHEKNILRDLATFSNGVPTKLLAEFEREKGRELSLKNAKAQGIVTSNGIINFTQETYREAIYNSMLGKERKRIHNSIAKFLESSTTDIEEKLYYVAYHYAEAGNKEKALFYLDRILNERLYENNYFKIIEVIDLKERLSGDLPFHLAEKRSQAYSYIGLYGKAIATLKRIKTHNTVEEIKKLLSIMRLYIDTGEIEKAKEYAEQVEKIKGKSLNDRHIELLYNANMGLFKYYALDSETSLTLLNKAAKIAKEMQDSKMLMSINGNLAVTYTAVNRLEEALSLYNEMLKGINSNYPKYTWTKIGIYINIANIYEWMEKHDMAITNYKKAMELARKNSFFYGYMLAAFNLVYTLISVDKLNRAEKELDKLKKYITILKYRWATARYTAIKGEILALSGHLEEAKEVMNRAITTFLESGMLSDAGAIFAFLIAIHILQRNRREINRLREKISKYPFIHSKFKDFFEAFDRTDFENIQNIIQLLPTKLAIKFLKKHL